jgi:hypothetical protein
MASAVASDVTASTPPADPSAESAAAGVGAGARRSRLLREVDGLEAELGRLRAELSATGGGRWSALAGLCRRIGPIRGLVCAGILVACAAAGWSALRTRGSGSGGLPRAAAAPDSALRWPGRVETADGGLLPGSSCELAVERDRVHVRRVSVACFGAPIFDARAPSPAQPTPGDGDDGHLDHGRFYERRAPAGGFEYTIRYADLVGDDGSRLMADSRQRLVRVDRAGRRGSVAIVLDAPHSRPRDGAPLWAPDDAVWDPVTRPITARTGSKPGLFDSGTRCVFELRLDGAFESGGLACLGVLRCDEAIVYGESLERGVSGDGWGLCRLGRNGAPDSFWDRHAAAIDGNGTLVFDGDRHTGRYETGRETMHLWPGPPVR